MEQEKNKKVALIIVIVALIIIGLVILISNKSNKTNNIIQNDIDEGDVTPKKLYNTTIDIQDYIEKVDEDKDYAKYNLDFSKVFQDENIYDIQDNYNISLKYMINDYKIQIKLLQSNSLADIKYKLYLNDKYVIDITTFKTDASFETLGKYLIYYNGICTDIRCREMYIINEQGNITTIYEMDNSSKGLIGDLFRAKVNSDGIIINASRFGHNLTLYANDKSYELLSKENCQSALNELTDNLVVEATYTYKYENGVLNLSPEISNKITLKEYIDNNEDACKQE